MSDVHSSGNNTNKISQKNIMHEKSPVNLLKHISDWLTTKNRLILLKWSIGYFILAAFIFIIVGLRYFSGYTLPKEPLAIAYTFSAFTSHFASIALICWAAVILPLIIFFPFKKIIIPFCILLISIIISLELLDSQIYTSHRFHFTMLTIRILGWKTWGFGIVYMFIFLFLNSFLAKMTWDRVVVQKKKSTAVFYCISTIVLVLFTHFTHIWADATGYIPVTRFTTALPLFYPSTDKKFMTKHGLADISKRRELPKNFQTQSSDFFYPKQPLQFNSSEPVKNILIICIDDMRSDVLKKELSPNILMYTQKSGINFTNHWSGGNSTKMGLFSLFYGIPPTYQQYIESNKRSPVLIDQIINKNYATGIFTSYKLYAPACLDVSAFVKIRDLRLETKIPGPPEAYRNDSAITQQWKEWLDKKPSEQPFFGFLFYDDLSVEGVPPSFKNRLPNLDGLSEQQKKFSHYKIGVQFVDSLVGTVLRDLEKRDLLKNTIVIITADHGEEYDDNKLGFTGHGSSFSDYQMRVPLIVFWPGKESNVVEKRTSHYDIIATLMSEGLGCTSDISDYCSGNNLFSEKQWNWLIAGSYFNFAIIEPQQVIVQYPGGYYEVRDHSYQIVPKISDISNLTVALNEMGRFFKK